MLRTALSLCPGASLCQDCSSPHPPPSPNQHLLREALPDSQAEVRLLSHPSLQGWHQALGFCCLTELQFHIVCSNVGLSAPLWDYLICSISSALCTVLGTQQMLTQIPNEQIQQFLSVAKGTMISISPFSTLQRLYLCEWSSLALDSAQLAQLCSAAPFQRPLLSYFTVTTVIDQFAGIDYSLVGAPEVTSEGLDTPFKVRDRGERALELRAVLKSALPSRAGSSPPLPVHFPVGPLSTPHRGQTWH